MKNIFISIRGYGQAPDDTTTVSFNKTFCYGAVARYIGGCAAIPETSKFAKLFVKPILSGNKYSG